MTRKEQDEATEKMRQMTKEEMLKVSPSDYFGECERVNFTYQVEGHDNIPAPILETEDDEFIKQYVEEYCDFDHSVSDEVDNISY